jgi:hypothetical protein
VQAALEARPEIQSLTIDLEHDRVDLVYDATRLSRADILEIIQAEGFDAEWLEEQQDSSPLPTGIERKSLPTDLMMALQKLEASGQGLLLSFYGPD